MFSKKKKIKQKIKLMDLYYIEYEGEKDFYLQPTFFGGYPEKDYITALRGTIKQLKKGLKPLK